MDKVAFQGAPGANSDLACREVFSGMQTLPCETFEDTLAAVREGNAARALIPVENSVAGRVADIHHLLPDSGLHITGEHFHRVRHQLLGVKGATIAQVKRVYSHVHALGQCRKLIRALGVEAVVHADTAAAARMVAQAGDPTQAAIASSLAGEIYGLAILRADVEDAAHNTTRFLVMEPQARWPVHGSGPAITSFLFQVRSVPAALYKALGGFATNGVNLTKIESYLDAGFNVAQFVVDVEGHPDDPAMKHALEELGFFSNSMTILGVYPAAPFRRPSR